ncbi:MAG: PucR family transcriptional regulator [Solirubrobacteraceae bacterium]|nr:MAG: hypothetical protein DLM63_02595 [Solirubrobacterales bacterium]
MPPRRPALSAVPDPEPASERTSQLKPLEALSSAVESGAGLFEVVRAAARVLDASLVLLDDAGAKLAVAARSPADERALSEAGARGSGRSDTEEIELRVGDEPVGRLRARWRSDPPETAVLALVRTLVAAELERRRGPERASRRAVGSLIEALMSRGVPDAGELVERTRAVGIDLSKGGNVIVARAHPRAPSEDDWRARVLAVAEGAARSVAAGAIAAPLGREQHLPPAEVMVVVPDADESLGRRTATAVARELEAALRGFSFAVGRGRPATTSERLGAAADEALLAANVAEGEGHRTLLDFGEIGAYRVLLPYMRHDAAELRHFYADTVEPLVAYDEQYETSNLVRTLETFLAADAVVADTAERLFTHRHTVRYRLERIRDLCGLDVNSSDGREKLSLGLKAMRVLGIAEPAGPALEAGTEAGRVPRRGQPEE